MNLLVISATEFEIAPFLKYIKSKAWAVDILIGGVGMISTAYALGKKLNEKKYDAVINVGIAGSFLRENELGSVLRVESDCFSELGAQNDEDFLSIDELGFGESTFNENASVFANLPSVLKLKKVKGITVNTVHGRQISITKIITRLNPEIESMEGASVFFAAEQAGIYSLQVRSISNFVEKRNRESWQMDLAINNLNQWLIEFFLELFTED